LDCTLLGDLLCAFYELLPFHRILGGNPAEMLGGEGRNTGIEELLSGNGDGIANGEDTGVEYTNHVAGIGFVHNFTLRGHQLLGLGKAHFAAALHMVVFRISLELAGADTHKGQSVSVGLVHICLNLKDKGGEIRVEGIHSTLVGNPGQGRGCQLEEVFQERLNAKVCQRRAKENRGELTPADSFLVHFPTGG